LDAVYCATAPLDTALRDIDGLLSRCILAKDDGQRRSTSYSLVLPPIGPAPHPGGNATISTVRHISLRVPQPGRTGAVSALVSYSQVTCTSLFGVIAGGVLEK
jgi:hypothetical protein